MTLRYVYRWFTATVFCIGLLIGSQVLAAGRAQLTIVADRNAPLVAQQTWVRQLGQAGIQSVRLRQKTSSDRPKIDVRGTKSSPFYYVIGVLDSQGNITLPDGRYRQGEAHRIAKWIKDLERLGPVGSREPDAGFGLSASQYQRVVAELAMPVGFATQGKPRREVIQTILRPLKLPIQIDQKLFSLGKNDPMVDELSGLATGTALAYALEPMGLVLVPKASARGPELTIVSRRGQPAFWPVGKTTKQRGFKIAPKLYKPHPINIANTPAEKVLEVIGKRVELPVLIDHEAMARHRVELSKLVKVPQSRLTYGETLDRILFQAMAKYELRLDDARHPFIWVTTIKQ